MHDAYFFAQYIQYMLPSSMTTLTFILFTSTVFLFILLLF